MPLRIASRSAALVLAFMLSTHVRSLESIGDPGAYDVLLFVRFWTPQACQQDFDESCQSLNASSWAVNNLALHGLWPSYDSARDGNDYPQDCWQDNDTYWEQVSVLTNSVTNPFVSLWSKYAPEYLFGLVTHEWQTHGTCYTSALIDVATNQDALDSLQANYLQNQMLLCEENPTPSILTDAAQSGKPVSLADLQDAFGGEDYVALNCDFDDWKASLNSVYLCYGHDGDGNPTTRIKCPSTVLSDPSDNSCAVRKATNIYIPAWGSIHA